MFLGRFWGLLAKMEAHCAYSHNQKKNNNNLKTKKQPELTENRTVWKSDSQGVKEETFIPTSRRGRDGQWGWRGLEARQWLEDRAGWGSSWRSRQSHICMQINWKNKWGLRQTTQPRVPLQGNKASKPLIENIGGGWGGSGRNSQPHRRVHWRDPQGPRMYTSPPTQ